MASMLTWLEDGVLDPEPGVGDPASKVMGADGSDVPTLTMTPVEKPVEGHPIAGMKSSHRAARAATSSSQEAIEKPQLDMLSLYPATACHLYVTSAKPGGMYTVSSKCSVKLPSVVQNA